MSIKSDSPITSSSEDRLSRSLFVENLARSISRAPNGDSIVFALYSKWGEGKTSAYNLLKEFLTKEVENAPPIIEFNPWFFSGREALLFALIEEIGDSLGSQELSKSVTGAEDKAKQFKKFASLLKLSSYSAPLLDVTATAMAGGIPVPAGSALKGIANSVVDIFSTVDGEDIKVATESASGALKSGAEALNFSKKPSISSAKKALEKELSDLESPILVVLDDVDRLLPREQVELFQIVKSTASLPNINYLILADKDVLEEGVSKTGLPKGYLEKIIQFGIELPKIRNNELRNILNDELNKIISDVSSESFSFKDEIKGAEYWRFFTNLRQVKRFVGEFNLRLPNLCHSGKYFELHVVDTINIHILKYFAPEIHSEIYKIRELFVNNTEDHISQVGYENKQSNDLRNALNTIYEKSSEEANHRLVKRVLNELFGESPAEPKTDYFRHDHYFEKRRLVSPYWFDVYFSNEKPLHIVYRSEAERLTQSLLDNDDNAIKSITDEILKRTGVSTLTRFIEGHEVCSTSENKFKFLKFILSAKEIASGREVIWSSPIRELFESWVYGIEEQHQQQELSKFVQTTEGLPMFSDYIRLARSNDPRYHQKSIPILKIFKTHGEHLSKEALRKADELGDKLFDEYFAPVVILYKNSGDYKAFRKRLLKFIEQNDSLILALENLGSYYDSEEENKFNTGAPVYLDVFPDYDELEQRMRGIHSQRGITDKEKVILEAYLDTKYLEWLRKIRAGDEFMKTHFSEVFDLKICPPPQTNSIIETPSDLTEEHILLIYPTDYRKTFAEKLRELADKGELSSFTSIYYHVKLAGDSWGDAYVFDKMDVEVNKELARNFGLTYYVSVFKWSEYSLISSDYDYSSFLGYSNEIFVDS